MGASKDPEPKHRPGTAVDSPATLFHDVIQIPDQRAAPGVVALERSQIRPAQFVQQERVPHRLPDGNYSNNPFSLVTAPPCLPAKQNVWPRVTATRATASYWTFSY